MGSESVEGGDEWIRPMGEDCSGTLDCSSMVLQNLDLSKFPRISPGTSWQKCELNRKIKVQGVSGEKVTGSPGDQEEMGSPGTVPGLSPRLSLLRPLPTLAWLRGH